MTTTARSLHIVAPDPTAQQQAASDPAASVWVNASAGSGKTTILTNRVTRLLLSGVKPQKILCLTFTRAAAAEMALRVMEKLSHWAVCSDNDLSASLGHLQGRAPNKDETIRARRLFAEALACPGGMRIRTLHAFGQEILRRFPIESGLPPHFSVIEEDDANALQDDILTELLREAGAAPDQSLTKALAILIDGLGEQGFRSVARNLLRERARLAKAIAHHGSLDTLVERLRSALGLAPDDTKASLIRAAFDPKKFPESEINDAAKLLQQGTPTYCQRGDMILTWLMRGIDERITTFSTYKDCFFTQKGELFAAYGDKKLLGKYPDLDRVLRREAMRLQSLAGRCAAVGIAETTAGALIFGDALIQRYSHQKRQRATLDYDDLVHGTLNLLQRPGIAPWVLHKLDDGLDHLLVDEAQDTSRAQWDIVKLLAEEFFSGATAHNSNRTLFVVGDEKQSIYSFQNADPDAFADMREFFKKKITDADKRYEEIPLHVSFRSAPAVLRAVDAVFQYDEAAKGVSADPINHLSFKADKLFGRVEVWPLLPHPKAVKEDSVWDLPIGYENEHDPQAELAAQIATTIKGWLSRGESLPGSTRPIRPGDIMILLRNRGRFADLMVRALKQKPNDVPVTGVDRMQLMKQLPVMDLLALIQFMLLPEDDLNLATVLRGPLLNMSEDELMMLAAQRGDLSLWQNLKNFCRKSAKESPSPWGGVRGGVDGCRHERSSTFDLAPPKTPPLTPPQGEGNSMAPAAQFRHNDVFEHAYTYLAAWLNKADFMTPFAALTGILNQPCPASSISGRRALWSRLGLDALDPIEELLNASLNFSRNHAPSLQNFLHWLSASDNEIKRELDNGKETGEGQVRIMTIHASKGLEAPIVFLPDTTNVPRVQNVSKFLWDDGLRLPFYLARKPDSGSMRTLWNQAREKQLEEYRRLMYVAMTRASHRLYVGGWELAKKEADGDGCWYNLIKTGLRSSEPHAQNANPDHIVWEDPALHVETGNTQHPTPSKIIPLQAWAFQHAPTEKAEERPLAPSQLAETPSAATPDQAYARGRIIHRLLQSLPDVATERRESAARRFLAHPQHALTQQQQTDALQEVLNLVNHPDFAPLFGPTSRAEVPLAGAIHGKPMSGQVDRLAILDGEVWVVDYKTNRPPPIEASSISDIYRTQMEAYRQVLQDIYPSYKVRCFLLWTYGASLMEVPH